MATDTGTPLITWTEFTSGAFADLVREYVDPGAQRAMLMEGTRIAEDAAGRRLAPFIDLVETHQAYGIDPDELSSSGDMPVDLVGAVGRSWANALGNSDLVRRMYVDQYAPRYAEMWTYSNVTISVTRTYGDRQELTGSRIMGPNKDSGLVWFRLGEFLPIGSEFEVMYSGGYTVATPASLARAVKYYTASLAVAELDPMRRNGQDPDMLREEANRIIVAYLKE